VWLRLARGLVAALVLALRPAGGPRRARTRAGARRPRLVSSRLCSTSEPHASDAPRRAPLSRALRPPSLSDRAPRAVSLERDSGGLHCRGPRAARAPPSAERATSSAALRASRGASCASSSWRPPRWARRRPRRRSRARRRSRRAPTTARRPTTRDGDGAPVAGLRPRRRHDDGTIERAALQRRASPAATPTALPGSAERVASGSRSPSASAAWRRPAASMPRLSERRAMAASTEASCVTWPCLPHEIGHRAAERGPWNRRDGRHDRDQIDGAPARGGRGEDELRQRGELLGRRVREPSNDDHAALEARAPEALALDEGDGGGWTQAGHDEPPDGVAGRTPRAICERREGTGTATYTRPGGERAFSGPATPCVAPPPDGAARERRAFAPVSG
jgi:hypothetical protein